MYKAIGIVLSLVFLEVILLFPLNANATERQVTLLVQYGGDWYQSLPTHHARFHPGTVEVDPHRQTKAYIGEEFFVIDVVVFKTQERVIWETLEALRTNGETDYSETDVFVDLASFYCPEQKWHFSAALTTNGQLRDGVTIGYFNNEKYDPDQGRYRTFDPDRRIYRITFPYAFKKSWYESTIGKYTGKYARGFADWAYDAVNSDYFNKRYYSRPTGPREVYRSLSSNYS